MNDQKVVLPELPHPFLYDPHGVGNYTEGQMREYALLAVREQASIGATTAINGIAANWFHDEGAIARCSCGRYSLDPKTLSDRQPTCDCGKANHWSGSFVKPDANSKWSGASPVKQSPAQPTVKQSLMVADVGQAHVTGYVEEDGIEFVHPQYGRGAFFTYNCARELFERPVETQQPTPAQSVPVASLEKADAAIDAAIQHAKDKEQTK